MNMFPQQYGSMQTGMNQSYGSYAAAPNTMMQNNMQAGQQMMQGSQPNMFAGQQQGFGQPRPPQPDYRGMAQNPRSQYLQQAPNVTMNANMSSMGGMGAQGGPAPPYSRQAPQGMQQGVQQQQQSQFQQQQRMRQQMMAMQQQQQQQGGPQGAQPSPALVAHLQRQMNPNPYQHQPPPYNM